MEASWYEEMSSLFISRPFRLEPQFERRPIQFNALFEMNTARIKLVHLIDKYEIEMQKNCLQKSNVFFKMTLKQPNM